MSQPPIHYAVVLFPGFQLLDAAGPLDVLNLLSTIPNATPENLTLTLLASSLDPVPTKLTAPGSNLWSFSPEVASSMNTAFNQTLLPTSTFTSYLDALSHDSKIDASTNTPVNPIDVLIIPGGLGTRIDRINAADQEASSNVADLVSFITTVSPHIRHGIVTVCTGSDVLASTGLLDGRRATTNMSRWDYVTGRRPDVKWQKAARWVRSPGSEADGLHGDGEKVVSDKPIYTSAGVSAGIDIMLAFVADHYGGVEVAREVARRLEYEWREVGEGEVDSLYDGWTI